MFSTYADRPDVIAVLKTLHQPGGPKNYEDMHSVLRTQCNVEMDRSTMWRILKSLNIYPPRKPRPPEESAEELMQQLKQALDKAAMVAVRLEKKNPEYAAICSNVYQLTHTVNETVGRPPNQPSWCFSLNNNLRRHQISIFTDDGVYNFGRNGWFNKSIRYRCHACTSAGVSSMSFNGVDITNSSRHSCVPQSVTDFEAQQIDRQGRLLAYHGINPGGFSDLDVDNAAGGMKTIKSKTHSHRRWARRGLKQAQNSGAIPGSIFDSISSIADRALASTVFSQSEMASNGGELTDRDSDTQFDFSEMNGDHNEEEEGFYDEQEDVGDHEEAPAEVFEPEPVPKPVILQPDEKPIRQCQVAVPHPPQKRFVILRPVGGTKNIGRVQKSAPPVFRVVGREDGKPILLPLRHQ